MADTSVLVNIGEMIDLAIGTPEVGVVDFNMLQTVLHCLAQQMRVLGKTVELKSSVTVPERTNRDPTQTIAISEFLVDTNDKTAEAKLMTPLPPTADQNTILVVDRVKRSISEPSDRPRQSEVQLPGDRTKQTDSQAPSSKSQGSSGGHSAQYSSATAGPGIVSSTEKLSLVTISKFNILENAVDDLKQRVYGSIPKNEDILEEVRSQTNLKAITDMWTSLNVSSRLEAAENGVAKLSSLVEDLIRESPGLTESAKQHASQYDSRPLGPDTDQADVDPESAKVAVGLGKSSEFMPTDVYKDLDNVYEHLDYMRADLDQLADTFYNTMKAMNVDVGERPPARVATARGGGAKSALASAAPASAAPASAVPTEVDSAEGTGQTKEMQGSKQQSAAIADMMLRLCELEKQQRRCCDLVAKSEGILQDQINSLQDQLEIMMKKQTSSTNQEISPDLVQDLKGLMQLFQTVQSMQEQLTQVHETALTLAAEKEDRQQHINALLEQIELLKTIKLDREDMVEAMAEKADMRMLARKVSHDQFELACDDLSRGLEHALGKLNVQESLWQQALDDIQREIETKLDKMELSPVKDFFNNKLKQLQDNLKVMASLRRDVEAAGTKRRLMRDVNCISCDAQAVMSMDPPMAMSSKPMPATHSMKPYLSYELDAIRKTQASNLPQRNLHDWETMDKTMSQPKPPQKVRSETDKHLCNRYCGGSHTVTTPSQRVARLGHFIKQWGPDVLPLSSGLATGDDGRMYKVSQPEGANVRPGVVEGTCTPKSPVKKSDTPKTPQKPLISGECRCLEGDRA